MQQQVSTALHRYLGLDSVYGVALPDACVDVLKNAMDISRCAVFPGFCDVHVHLREPGFSYKETIAAGTRAAARGGYTDVCTMPNLDPVPDSLPHLQQQLDIIARDAVIGVHPYGAITCGEKGEALADLEALAPLTAGFSDDGRGVQSMEVMQQAMQRAASLGKVLAAHCEDETLLFDGCVHDGAYARSHGRRGIVSQSEWGQLLRDLELVRRTGCAYHICHVSCAESVALLRWAKSVGLNVTAETAPHYLTLSENDLQDEGRFKLNPPLRTARDREALLEGLLDGTIDMVATDHAPHSEQEKAGGLWASRMGVVGLETAFPVLYTHLVRSGRLPLDRLLYTMADAPRKRFGIPQGEDFSIWEMDEPYTVTPAEFLSQGRSTPFAGQQVYGRCLATIRGGKFVWLQE